MERKFNAGQRVIFKCDSNSLIGTVLSVNWEFTVIKFDNQNEISLLRKDEILELRPLEDVPIS